MFHRGTPVLEVQAMRTALILAAIYLMPVVAILWCLAGFIDAISR